MAETIEEVVADMERSRGVDRPIIGSLVETGLGPEAEAVIEKLKNARNRGGRWHRIYRKAGNEWSLKDALTDRDIEIRDYAPDFAAEPMVFRGNSPARRDVAVLHRSPNALYLDVWVGETLE
jgi:hypothetical protein